MSTRPHGTPDWHANERWCAGCAEWVERWDWDGHESHESITEPNHHAKFDAKGRGVLVCNREGETTRCEEGEYGHCPFCGVLFL